MNSFTGRALDDSFTERAIDNADEAPMIAYTVQKGSSRKFAMGWSADAPSQPLRAIAPRAMAPSMPLRTVPTPSAPVSSRAQAVPTSTGSSGGVQLWSKLLWGGAVVVECVCVCWGVLIRF